MKARLAILPGDGIGPEVIESAVACLETVAARFGHQFDTRAHLIGGCAIDAAGVPLPPETLEACLQADAVLLGAVGGPKWDQTAAKDSPRPEQGLLGLRKALGVYANLRPVRHHPALAHTSPLKADRLAGVDLLVVRELTGGLYFGQPKGRSQQGGHVQAVDTLVYQDYEIERILEMAFQLAAGRRKKVTSVDKANVLESSRLWREIAGQVALRHPDISLDHLLVDTAAMRLVSHAASFDVIVTENMFGDILTDEAAVLAGSMGLLPSASLGGTGPGLYEPIHGSAPDIAGKGIANPIGAILSAAMLLRYSLHLEAEAQALESAVDRTITQNAITADLGGSLGTKQVAASVIKYL
jgi:3-isopropylmalate dehydrogenase